MQVEYFPVAKKQSNSVQLELMDRPIKRGPVSNGICL
jgi:hypothetical protein